MVLQADARGGRNLKYFSDDRRRELSAVGFQAWAAINMEDVHADFSRGFKRVLGVAPRTTRLTQIAFGIG
jgi:hypothetical protein